MAIVGRPSLPSKLRRLLRDKAAPATRSISSSTPSSSSSSAAVALPQPVDKHDAGAQIIDLDDTERLFASTPTPTLLRSLASLYAMALNPVVDLGIAVMRSRALEQSAVARAVVMAAVKETVYRQFCAGEGVEEAGRTLEGLWDEGLRGILDYSLEDAEDNAGCDANLAEFLKTVEMTSRLPPSSKNPTLARAVVMAAVKETVYRQFCAGEGVEEAGRTLQGLWDEGLRGILDYSLEDVEDNARCDANLAEFLKTVEMTSRLPPSSVSFACTKISAICPVTLLERVSDLLRWEQKNPSAALPWRRHWLPVLSDRSPFYHTTSAPRPLTPTEEHDLQLAHQRLTTLCAKCVETNIPLLIDAEYTSVQPAIDYLSYDAAVHFNRDSEPVVYGTIQAYLRDSMERLVLVTEAADREGIRMGFKLVRGAYMTSEARVAAALGAASPIHPSVQETHACYNQCTCFMLEKAARGSGSVVLATHNLESGKVAAAKAEELGMGKGNQRLQFAQLKGMADALSLGLRNAGFNVSKYLPFGPVDKVVPYLVRRAEENRGLLSASSLDRQLMGRELKSRLACSLPGRYW